MHFDLPVADRPIRVAQDYLYKVLIFISFIWNLWGEHTYTPYELSIFTTVSD